MELYLAIQTLGEMRYLMVFLIKIGTEGSNLGISGLAGAKSFESPYRSKLYHIYNQSDIEELQRTSTWPGPKTQKLFDRSNWKNTQTLK